MSVAQRKSIVDINTLAQQQAALNTDLFLSPQEFGQKLRTLGNQQSALASSALTLAQDCIRFAMHNKFDLSRATQLYAKIASPRQQKALQQWFNVAFGQVFNTSVNVITSSKDKAGASMLRFTPEGKAFASTTLQPQMPDLFIELNRNPLTFQPHAPVKQPQNKTFKDYATSTAKTIVNKGIQGDLDKFIAELRSQVAALAAPAANKKA